NSYNKASEGNLLQFIEDTKVGQQLWQPYSVAAVAKLLGNRVTARRATRNGGSSQNSVIAAADHNPSTTASKNPKERDQGRENLTSGGIR
ncbi:hypothetical protein PIB30_092299, partial [Stylosanthes scabra]|nr:hypothetical protein [Stylosanthes scabra]